MIEATPEQVVAFLTGGQAVVEASICAEFCPQFQQLRKERDAEIERLRGHKEEADRHIATIAGLRAALEMSELARDRALGEIERLGALVAKLQAEIELVSK